MKYDPEEDLLENKTFITLLNFMNDITTQMSNNKYGVQVVGIEDDSFLE